MSKKKKVFFFLFVVITKVVSKRNENSLLDKNDTLITNNNNKNLTSLTELNVNNVTIRKCCPFEQFRYDLDLQREERCLVSDNLNPMYSIRETGFIFNVIIEEVNCSKFRDEDYGIMVEMQPKIHKNGSIIVEGTGTTSGPDKYCIDNFVYIDPETNLSRVELRALICYPNHTGDSKCELSCICMLISCFFILLTVAVYALLPKLRNLHGMVLIACLLSFFVGLILLSIMQILLNWHKISRNTCSIFTFVIYYALLAAFFWLNVMCYDIWRTISGKPSMFSHLPSQKNRFISYSMYAFGIPIVFTIILAVTEFTVAKSSSPWLPHIGDQRCFLYGPSKFLYLYVPIIILCAVNLIFFILTTKKIAEIKKQTDIVNKTDKQRFILYIKLFMMMGVNWILEVISSFYDDSYIWQLIDAYNALVGVIYFLIFICKVKTWKRLQERYRQVMNPRRDRSSLLTSTQTTNTHSKEKSNWNFQQQTRF